MHINWDTFYFSEREQRIYLYVSLGDNFINLVQSFSFLYIINASFKEFDDITVISAADAALDFLSWIFQAPAKMNP